jgi:hypothetical protein
VKTLDLLARKEREFADGRHANVAGYCLA